MNKLVEKITKVNWEDDTSVIDFIKTADETDNFTGENIVVSINGGKTVRISTYQKNGWIRVNTYTIDKEVDEILGTERYVLIRETIIRKFKNARKYRFNKM